MTATQHLLFELGCDGFIQKPFDIIELSQKLREVLDSKIYSSAV